nr:YndJ family protein [Pseudofrankia saprophytica]
MSAAAPATGLTPYGATLLALLIAIGMLVVMPWGLGLLDLRTLDPLRRLWPLAALPGAVSFLVPRGPVAAALAGVYAAGTVALLAALPEVAGRATDEFTRVEPGFARVESGDAGRDDPRRGRLPAPVRAAMASALVAPVIASSALVATGAGYPLFGYSPTVLALTVAHFHYAGFAAALIAALVCRALPGDPRAGAAAWSVPAGTLVVLAGFFLSDWVELAGAVILTVGLWLAAWLTWRRIRPRGDRLARCLVAVSCAVLPLSMALALSWAVGRAAGLPHLSVTWMIATHGIANALGFAVCALLAWRRLDRPTLATSTPATSREARP